MQILVLYYSRSGNTEKLAGAVARGAGSGKDVTVLLKNTEEVTIEEFCGSDAVIAGSPVYYGTMAAELKSVFDRFVGARQEMEGKVGAAFATSGDASGGKETTILSIVQAMLINGMIIAGDPMEATGHYGTSCVGAPDKEALKNAELLGKRVAAIASKLT